MGLSVVAGGGSGGVNMAFVDCEIQILDREGERRSGSMEMEKWDYDRPQYSSYSRPSAYADDALDNEYKSYAHPKPRLALSLYGGRVWRHWVWIWFGIWPEA
ncbi:Uncharacterized protein LOK49_LG04G03063 [Camellia lanceoleosa]|uniref:Uncharacterized protein n=1 Tax=Camellia lanceoleosa TaxID=1840588 RepID=A0ACC0HXW4_9ERIC|nr:Uncharacterized protein LOK49_LG04G03063 [Camellia lanceoleosa]